MFLVRLIGRALLNAQMLGKLCIEHYLLSRFASVGRRVSLGPRVRVYGPDRIRIGDDVSLAQDVVLRAQTYYPWSVPPQQFTPEIVIGDQVFINSNTQIASVNRVEIGRHVMIASNCFIADSNHFYQDVATSIREQPLVVGEIRIGADSWIGANCCIVGTVRVGCHSVVAANSVVTADVPDLTVVGGVPARILKQYDTDQACWVTMKGRTNE